METLHNMLGDLLSFDTSTDMGRKSCLDFVSKIFQDAGMIVESVPKPNGKPGILWATFPEKKTRNIRGGVLFSGHLDVVPVSKEGWNTDPFQMVKKEDKIFGRGSCDMKGFIGCVLSNISKSKNKAFYKPMHVCLSFDEEEEMEAIKMTGPLLKKYAPEWCWVGEPSSMEMIDMHRGCVTGIVGVKGLAAHGSTPDKGLSAIEVSIDIINHIRTLAEECKRNPFANSPFENPYTVFNFGKINGGTAANVVADSCEFTYQYRPHPGENIKKINQQIDTYITEISSKFESFPGTGIVVNKRLIDDDLNNENNLAAKNLSCLLGNTKTRAENYVTEAGFIQKMGVPTVICGPGSIEQAHKNNEYVPVPELIKCNAMVQTLCAYLCNSQNLTLSHFVSCFKQKDSFERKS